VKNWNRHITLILFVFLGFLLTPNLIYACSKTPVKTEHQKVSKSHHEKAEKKDCCKTKSCKDHQHDNGYNGKCKDNSCRCGNSSFSFLMPIDFKSITSFNVIEKRQFEFTQSYYSLGHYSIWQPPKIS